jgi:hypothetical protein
MQAQTLTRTSYFYSLNVIISHLIIHKEGLGYVTVCAIASRSFPPTHVCICNCHTSSDLRCVRCKSYQLYEVDQMHCDYLTQHTCSCPFVFVPLHESFCFRGHAASIVKSFPTFRQTLQLPSSGWMCVGEEVIEPFQGSGSGSWLSNEDNKYFVLWTISLKLTGQEKILHFL